MWPFKDFKRFPATLELERPSTISDYNTTLTVKAVKVFGILKLPKEIPLVVFRKENWGFFFEEIKPLSLLPVDEFYEFYKKWNLVEEEEDGRNKNSKS